LLVYDFGQTEGFSMKTRAALASAAGKPLERINQAFELMHAGESICSVVTYS
jgi:hypothetical protein